MNSLKEKWRQKNRGVLSYSRFFEQGQHYREAIQLVLIACTIIPVFKVADSLCGMNADSCLKAKAMTENGWWPENFLTLGACTGISWLISLLRLVLLWLGGTPR